MHIFGLVLICIGALLFIFGVVLLLDEKKQKALLALIFALAFAAGGAEIIDHYERRTEKIPVITDHQGYSYNTKVYSITNHFGDTFYSVPKN